MLRSLNTKNETLETLSKGLDMVVSAPYIKNIYSNPDTYAGKQVLVVGYFANNDLKGKMVTLDSEDTSIECYYGSEGLFQTEMDWKNYSNTSNNYKPIAIAYGYMQRYNDSNDVYLVINKYAAADYNEVSNVEVLRTVASWNILPLDKQEAHPLLKITIPTYYPQDTLPLYRLYNIKNRFK